MLTNSRGLALAVMLCGSGIASSITPLLTNALINALGWRGAYVALASLFAVVVFPVLWFFFFDLRRTSTRETSVPLSGWTVRQGLRSRQKAARSEEHTSELQSLMRISYAVFCLKKKNDTDKHAQTP